MGKPKHTCITSLEELGDYRTDWERLRKEVGGSIYSAHSLNMLWMEAFGEGAFPRVVVVEDGGELLGVVPLYLRIRNTAGFPVKTLSLIGQGGDLGFNNLGVLFRPDRTDAISEAVAGVGQLDWHVLSARSLEEAWCVKGFIDQIQSSWRSEDYPVMTATVCPLPEGDIMSCFGKRTRSNLRNRMNGLEKEGRVRLAPLSQDNTDSAADTYARHHIERWEDRGGSVFLQPRNVAFLKAVLRRSASEGYLFGYELLIDDQVAAQTFGFLQEEMARGYLMGMNEQFAKNSPGLVLMAYAMDDLRNRGIKAVDTGAGTEGYKEHMNGYKVQIRGLRANRGIVSLLSRVAGSPTAKRVDSALGLKQKFFEGVYE